MARNFSPCQTAFASLNPLSSQSGGFEWFSFECVTTHWRGGEGDENKGGQTKKWKNRIGKRGEREREVENERGTISDLVYVLYEKRARRGGRALAVVGCATPAIALPK